MFPWLRPSMETSRLAVKDEVCLFYGLYRTWRYFEERYGADDTMDDRWVGRRAGRCLGDTGWIAAGTLAAYAVMGGTKSALAEREKTDPAGAVRRRQRCH